MDPVQDDLPLPNNRTYYSQLGRARARSRASRPLQKWIRVKTQCDYTICERSRLLDVSLNTNRWPFCALFAADEHGGCSKSDTTGDAGGREWLSLIESSVPWFHSSTRSRTLGKTLLYKSSLSSLPLHFVIRAHGRRIGEELLLALLGTT